MSFCRENDPLREKLETISFSDIQELAKELGVKDFEGKPRDLIVDQMIEVIESKIRVKQRGKTEEEIAKAYKKFARMIIQKMENPVEEGQVDSLDQAATTSAEANLLLLEKNKLSNRKSLCICGSSSDESLVITCSTQGCGATFHHDCHPWKMKDLQNFECPSCIILNNDPLNQVLQVLIEPSILVSDLPYHFSLTKHNLDAIATNPSIGIEVRSIKLDGEHFFEQTWPDKGLIRLNRILIREIKPLLLNSSLKKRKDERMVVSKDLVEGDNSLVFSFENIKDGKNTKLGKDPKYVFAVLLIKKIPPADLIKKIVAESSLPAEKGKAKFEERFVLGRDKDIEMNEIKIDILDNVSLTPISLPARGIFCDHPQCFSLDTFVKSMANEVRRKWACPVCKRRSPRFVIDLYVEQQIREALQTDRSIEQILFHKDGSVSYPASKSKKDALKQLQIKREALKAQASAEDPPNPDLANPHNASLVEVLSIGSNENDLLDASPRDTADLLQVDTAAAKPRTGDYTIESKSPSHKDARRSEKKSLIEDEKKSEQNKLLSTGTTSANESNKQPPEAATPMDPLSQLKLVEDKRFIQHLYNYLSKYKPRTDQPRGFFDYHQSAAERCRDSYYLSKYIDLLHKFVLEKKGLAVADPDEDATLGKRCSEERRPPSPAYFLQTEHNHSRDL